MKILSVLKCIVKDLSPPLLWRIIRQLKDWGKKNEEGEIAAKPEWEYISDGWSDKVQLTVKGWNVESVLETQKANWQSFVGGLDNTLPFGISPEAKTLDSSPSNRIDIASHNLLITYAYVLALAAHNRSSISMLDWGGGIGHYYLLSQKLVPSLNIDYHCKEVPVLAHYGQSLFPEACFYDDDTCLERFYDFILVSGSFQYLQDWKRMLRLFSKATHSYIFITRLPVVHTSSTFVMVQRPYKHGYDTEYLGWCFNRTELLECSRSIGLKLIREFAVEQLPPVHLAPEQPMHWGFLFQASDRTD